MHRDRVRDMDEMFGSMALTDGRDGDHHQRRRDDRHGREHQPGRPQGSDVAPYGGHRDPFSFMTSMMSGMQNMMGNAFRQMVCTRLHLSNHHHHHHHHDV